MSEQLFVWLIISPEIFVDFLGEKRLLMYNVSNGKFLYSNDKGLYDIVVKMYLPKNLGVIPYEPSLEHTANEAIRQGFFSVRTVSNAIKPISLLPMLSLQKDLERNKDDKYARLGNKLYYLSGLYVSLDCCVTENEMLARCRNMASRQYPCACYEEKYAYLDYKMLQELISQTIASSVAVIDFICSYRYFLECDVQDFVNLLRNYSFKYRIHIYVEDYALLGKQNVQSLSSCCQFIIYRDSFSPTYANKGKNDMGQEVRSLKLIYDSSDIEDGERMECLPVWLDDNEQMFREKVWTSGKDLMNNPRKMSYLFRNKKLNANFFGILDVSCTGEVRPHGSSSKLGNVNSGYTLLDAVSAEFVENHSWRMTRKDLVNCHSCPFRYVCPPVSACELMRPDLKMCNLNV